MDPKAASRIEPLNVRRIIRALEVIELTGRPFSSFGPGVDAYPIESGEIIGLFPGWEVLEERIRSRNDVLFDKGWIDECRFLTDNFSLSVTAAKAIGYSEIFDLLAGKISLQEAKELVDHLQGSAVKASPDCTSFREAYSPNSIEARKRSRDNMSYVF